MSDEKAVLSGDPDSVTAALNPGSSNDNNLQPGLEKKSHKSSVQIQEPPVSERRGYSIVKVEEKHGPLHRAIPVMPLPLAIVCCLLNLFLPGVGTFISAFSVFCCGPTRMAKRGHAFGLNLASALLQMITFFVIVGWIWSILWGMTFVQLTLDERSSQIRRQESRIVQRHYSREDSKTASPMA